MTYANQSRLTYIGEGYEAVDQPPTYRYAPQHVYPMSLGEFGQLAPAPALPGRFSLANINMRQVIAAILVVIVAALIMRQLLKMTRGPAKMERNAIVSRVSTKELAQRLYERLENKGRANPATMRSLERIAR